MGYFLLETPAPPPPPTTPSLPSVGSLGLWRYLPQLANITYVSERKSGDITLTLSAVVTTPRAILERSPSHGVYRQWVTTVKIDADVWLAAVAVYNAAHSTSLVLYPKARDRVTLHGKTWQVSIDTSQPHQGNPYRLACNILEFQLDLDDQVRFVQASCGGSSDTGARTVTHTTSTTTIQCAIVPSKQAVDTLFGALTSPESFDIYLTPDSTYIPEDGPSLLKAGAMLIDQNSVSYEIVTVEQRERLDQLLHVTAVKKL